MSEEKKTPVHDEHGAELEFDLPSAASPSSTRIAALVLVGLVGIGALFLLGLLPRLRARTRLVNETKAAASRPYRVQVFSVKMRSGDRDMTLPGSVMSLEEAVIYPRASGYIRSWKVDIGDKVKAGQLLAVIDVPEIDQQLAQARAQLAQANAALVQAKANRLYSRTNLERLQALAPKGVASQQDLERAQSQSVVDESSVEVGAANVEAQRANMARFQQLVAFSRVTAPFAGTINMRNIERGTLVSGTTPLFRLSQTDTLRVFVQMPQNVAPSVTVGAGAVVSVRELAGRTFEGKVSRTAAALDATSRTMTTEIRVPNEKHELLAGMYATVAITLPSPHRVLEVPATAVLADARGMHVAVVENGTVRLAVVTVERDNGATMDVASGIRDTDKIVKMGTAELYDGQPVEVVSDDSLDVAVSALGSTASPMRSADVPNIVQH